ncbi:unnamed protein product [Adineta steineri]|uniref:Uncharacterized protein n=3 Tax=Adineta steineri TaxID=433720 RepID=A0A815N2V5_9BILA|nr:unnamed protein product [Adineta steineri]CAF1622668.1 unnamed protein product [Adineta steineri]
MEIENKLNGSDASNLCFSSLKSRNIERSKHAKSYEVDSNHHVSLSNEDVNNDEQITSSYTIPDKNSLKMDKNPTPKSNHHHHSSKKSKKRGFGALLNRKKWPNPFVQGQNNDENADAYKIFSILYGLVIFIGGVAFSISHAIIPREEGEKIKHLAAIYFTYLYWVSICWIIFCIIDIVRHKRKLGIHSERIDKLDSNRIRSKMFQKHQDFKLSPTPQFNLQIFDNSDDDDNNAEENDEINSTVNKDNESSQDNQSLDNLSSLIGRPFNVLMRRQILDPSGTQTLRNYVSHRKDTIVQRVIGYNYDDHSTAGGLYIRVGIGIFCLGTVIHSGLSILSNLENFVCTRWTTVMDDFSRLLFSFIQFFFIFKHSNLIIRAHESFARLAVMHVLVTNLCVWFRMVVNETKSQILEMSAHEMAIGQHNPIVMNSNYSIKNVQNIINQIHCTQSMEDTLQMTAYINEGYMKLKPLLYPCTIEFSLMCLTLFFLIWENIGKTFTYKTSDKASTKNVFMVNCHASIKGLFAGMIIFACTVISVILYAVFRNKIGDDINPLSTELTIPHPTTAATAASYRNRSSLTPSAHGPFTSLSKTPKKLLYSIAIIEIVNLCLIIISLVATIWALLKIRKLQYRRIATRFDNVLIIVSLTGIYLYSIFSAFALLNNKNSATWIAYVKIVIVILEFIEGTVHAFFILVALHKRLNHTSKHEYPAREVITLLIILDLSLWFEETTTTTKHEANPFQLAFYHVIPWSIIAAIATPLQIFFRFHASVCLAHVWENMYTLPASETVAPHGL